MKCVKEGVLRLSLSGDNASFFVFRLYPDSTRPSGWAKSADMFEQAGPGLKSRLREDSLIDFGDVSSGPLSPSSRNVKFQNDPLIVVSIAVSRANGPRPKHAPRIILTNGDQG